ncbi:diguanylate cyclase [Polymorphum gilvum]|uniref:Sensory transducction histidine kinase n=1 Tax=Polymorphum gilvum (strain LMG 25793 / CGMCC 1.9160 / SL003B-26A1) TaxID=991905 RepID=F2IWY6_POLGS|nr:transporter substrate-binding domain-containing protein [Polymorphum gilvum]ADZ71563.1 sensory transducction histidine kinase [Polymorphum gilvum SL003B-26A1]
MRRSVFLKRCADRRAGLAPAPISIARRLLPFLVLCLILSLALPGGALPGAVAAARAASADLDAEERAWTEANPTISVGVVSDNEPYSFFRNGQIMGWTVDVLRRLEAATGLSFEIRMGTWHEIYGDFRSGGLDVIADISRTEERSGFIDFTDAYHLRRTVLFHNVDRPLADDGGVDALRHKRVGIIKDIYYAPALHKAGIEAIDYASYRDLMAAVAFGWVDAVLAAEMTGNFFVRENGFSNVIAAGSLPLTDVALEDFRLGVLKDVNDRDKAILHGVLNKAVAALATDELAATTERWLAYRSGHAPSVTPLRLLPEEQDFIESAPPLSIGFISDYEPFSFLADGRGQGLAVDLAHDISAQTGLVLNPVYDNWSNLLARFKAGDLDIIANISRTDERADYTLFSQEYHRIPNAVFVRSGFGPYTGLESLAGKSVGIGKDIYYADKLKARLGNVRTYSTQEDIVLALSRSEVDAAIVALSNGNAIVRRLGLINIEIGGEFEMEGVEREDLRFGVSPQYPFVKSILDRAMSAMPLSRWAALETNWLGPRLAGAAPKRAPLTTEERAYLDAKGVVKVCLDPDMPPFATAGKDGTLSGLAPDIMSLLATRGGFAWQAVTAEGGGNALDTARRLGCDVVPLALEAGILVHGWDVTTPYLRLPIAVATQLHRPFVDGMRDLDGQTVGVVPGRVPANLLGQRYPKVTLVEVASEDEGLRLVQQGRLDALLGTLARLGYLITTMGANDIKISGRIAEHASAVVATRADEPLLDAIFTKLVADLDQDEVQVLLNKQILVPLEQTVDYTLLLQMAGVAALLLAMFLYWNRKLYALNTALNAANQKLHAVSITDGLTGLFNRRHFDTRGTEEFGLCQRNGWLFSIAMVDVDHFKRVNDEVGHVAGDLCLQRLAYMLHRHFRRNGDTVARYGGEEFVVYTMGGTAADFRSHLERLRAAVDSTPVETEAGLRHLTVSIGCHAAVPAPEQSLDDFIALADARLYDAKNQGRNRLVANA